MRVAPYGHAGRNVGPPSVFLPCLPPRYPPPPPPPPPPTARAQVFAAILRHVDWEVVRCLVIAGPGFAKDQFREYLEKGGLLCFVYFLVSLLCVGYLDMVR